MGRRRRRATPQMILWDRKQQQRFVDAVEKLVSFTNDLCALLAAKKRRSAAAFKANETRRAASNGAEVKGELPQ